MQTSSKLLPTDRLVHRQCFNSYVEEIHGNGRTSYVYITPYLSESGISMGWNQSSLVSKFARYFQDAGFSASRATMRDIPVNKEDEDNGRVSNKAPGIAYAMSKTLLAPRDYGRAFLTEISPKNISVVWNTEVVYLSALSIAVTSQQEEFDFVEGSIVDLRVNAFCSLRTQSPVDVRRLCQKVLNKPWEEGLAALHEIRRVSSDIQFSDAA